MAVRYIYIYDKEDEKKRSGPVGIEMTVTFWFMYDTNYVFSW